MWNIMMEICFEWTTVGSVDAKGVFPSASLPSAVSWTARGTMCPKGSAARCVKVRKGANSRLIRMYMVQNFNIKTDLIQCRPKIEKYCKSSLFITSLSTFKDLDNAKWLCEDTSSYALGGLIDSGPLLPQVSVRFPGSSVCSSPAVLTVA